MIWPGSMHLRSTWSERPGPGQARLGGTRTRRTRTGRPRSRWICHGKAECLPPSETSGRRAQPERPLPGRTELGPAGVLRTGRTRRAGPACHRLRKTDRETNRPEYPPPVGLRPRSIRLGSADRPGRMLSGRTKGRRAQLEQALSGRTGPGRKGPGRAEPERARVLRTRADWTRRAEPARHRPRKTDHGTNRPEQLPRADRSSRPGRTLLVLRLFGLMLFGLTIGR